MKKEPFVIERSYHAPAEMVWEAITDAEKMKAWYFDIPSFKPQVGLTFQFYGGTEEKQYLHLCRITDVIPGKKIRYSWSYEGYPGESFVTFELFPEGEKTRLKLTHEGLDTFPADNPDFKQENFIQGWTEIVGTSLKDYVQKVNA